MGCPSHTLLYYLAAANCEEPIEAIGDVYSEKPKAIARFSTLEREEISDIDKLKADISLVSSSSRAFSVTISAPFIEYLLVTVICIKRLAMNKRRVK